MSQPIILLKSVHKKFQTTEAVKDLSLDIQTGEVYGFLGPNGAGKTTTIRMLTGILLPDSGSVQVMGKDYERHRHSILSRIGYIPDRAYLYPKLTGAELLLFLGSLRGLSRGEIKKRSHHYFDMFNLRGKEHELIERYSHGMRQKLILITALMHNPDLIIVDEPMVGLDPRAARQIKLLFRELALEGKTIFMSTHSLDIAAEVCDRVGIIHHGSMVASDRPELLMQRMKRTDDSHGEQVDPDLEAVFMALTEDLCEPPQ